MELQKPVKMAYKLNHRVIHPGPIERQTVLLAQAVFHESTINALHYYGSVEGHSDFLETEKFIFIINSWWKLVNVRSKFSATKSRDQMRETITAENLVEKTRYSKLMEVITLGNNLSITIYPLPDIGNQ